MGLRKNYKGMSDVQKKNFVSALYVLKNSGVVENFAQIHAKWFSLGIHGTSHFLPWHREMLYRFEQELQKVDSSVSIPYWDSTADNSSSSPLWDNNFLGQFDSAWNLKRAFGAAPGSHLPTLQQVQTNHNRGTYDAFWPELELDIHNPPHQWVGGEMGSVYSPRDPAFYLHHCWIDMLWAWWQTWHVNVPFVASPPTWRSWGENDPLLEWPDRTPATVLNHRSLLYRYDIDHWLAAGDVLNPSDFQYSYNGEYMLKFDKGLLVFQTVDQKVLWQSSDPTTGTSCIMQSDGNLVIYDKNHSPIWASNTYGRTNSANGNLLIQANGYLGIYGSDWKPLSPNPWSRPPPSRG